MKKLALVLLLCATPSSAFAALGHTNPLIMNRSHVPTMRFPPLRQSCQIVASHRRPARACRIPNPLGQR